VTPKVYAAEFGERAVDYEHAHRESATVAELSYSRSRIPGPYHPGEAELDTTQKCFRWCPAHWFLGPKVWCRRAEVERSPGQVAVVEKRVAPSEVDQLIAPLMDGLSNFGGPSAGVNRRWCSPLRS
jgi:hypothetical protein